MALSKKEAKKVAAVLSGHLGSGAALDAIATLVEAKPVKNKAFNKSLKRIENALEQPKEKAKKPKAASKKAA